LHAATNQATPLAVNRRSAIVLITLVGAMTVASGLLLLAEPGAVPLANPLSLLAVEQAPASPGTILFDTAAAIEPHRWSSIVITHSGTPNGSAKSLNQLHERAGIGGLGYHFVLDNDQGGFDGQIEVGFRWLNQIAGAQLSTRSGYKTDHDTIYICLVGDTWQNKPTQLQVHNLIWLVQKLQNRLGIPAKKVMLANGLQAAPHANSRFPQAWFRQQLLTLGPQ